MELINPSFKKPFKTKIKQALLQLGIANLLLDQDI